MEQLPIPPPKSNPTGLPTPQDLVGHYQAQGLDPQEASFKVIDDLQKALFRVVAAGNSKRPRKDTKLPRKDTKLASDAARKLEMLNTRLAVVDMKVDSKPGYLEAFSIGVASGAALRGLEGVWPHVVEGVAQIWGAVSSATKNHSGSG